MRLDSAQCGVRVVLFISHRLPPELLMYACETSAVGLAPLAAPQRRTLTGQER
ncbi:hypothetical protein LAUMK4_02994 [Mycobacterium persicum]|uniref:Uncharacterized protein n=1 Tax=Mycobacterium persicum TaxID=1487726 RepID=A0ABY6RJQ3_9MYCO|nr:hypothetical protein LAUMK15_03320 [Mycobacterium persicum]VAZ94975.1 hypothetical protein LAUMK4_02994 [Mycobacterium persicum]